MVVIRERNDFAYLLVIKTSILVSTLSIGQLFHLDTIHYIIK